MTKLHEYELYYYEFIVFMQFSKKNGFAECFYTIHWNGLYKVRQKRSVRKIMTIAF